MINKTTINNKTVIYYESNNDRVPLILVHGWAGTFKNWEKVIPILEKDFKIIAINLPGCGGSEELSAEHTIKNYVNFLRDFVTTLQLSKFYLMGESLGGLISLDYANSSPDNLGKLVLVATPLKSPLFMHLACYGMKLMAKSKAGLFIADKVRVNNFLLKFWGKKYLVGNNATSKEFIEKQKAKSLESSSKVWLESGGDALVHDMTDNLESLKIPVLYLYSSKDKLTQNPTKQINSVKIKIEVLPGLHRPYDTDPELFSRKISNFLLEN